jgi:hypothetical protein
MFSARMVGASWRVALVPLDWCPAWLTAQFQRPVHIWEALHNGLSTLYVIGSRESLPDARFVTTRYEPISD